MNLTELLHISFYFLALCASAVVWSFLPPLTVNNGAILYTAALIIHASVALLGD